MTPPSADDFPDLGPRETKPIATPRSVASHVRLSPAEGFVLSRVDGKTSYREICAMTGLGLEASLEILRKLRRERLILHVGEAVDTPAPVLMSGEARASEGPQPTSFLQRHDDGSPVDAGDLAQGPGLDLETKARILRLHRRMRDMTAHELLCVPTNARGSVIKRAYFAASKELHPDRHYGVDLGPYRDKLNDIFAELTRAFDRCKK